ncbi:MAG TPA: NAD(P)-dependent oxidoreductase [Candidatus Binatia bacterium]|nr:NAD(P)-dependent oxidoreductase [Candidatus Binatia bacterium]
MNAEDMDAGRVRVVGWIGLGIMGRPMADHLRRAGLEVTAYNRGASRREAFARAGGKVAASAREAADGADVLVTMVSDTKDVEEVLFGANAAADALRRGAIAVDMSTISPRATREIAGRLRNRGIEALDAPVSGGEAGAIAATLSIMVGGDAAVFERCAPLFAALGKRATRMGPNGSGQATKLVNQVAVLGNLLATCEALVLARAAGLELARVIDAVGAGAGGSWQLTQLGPKMIADDFAPGFPVRLARKDLRLILEAAEELQVPLPLVALVQQLFSALAAAGEGDSGTQALIAVLERLAKRPQ